MDGELIFQVQSRGPNPLRVGFQREGNSLYATCTCNAGVLGKLCRHRLALMKGESAGVLSGNAELVPVIQELFKDSEGELAMKALLEAEASLVQAEALFNLKLEAFQKVVRSAPA